MDSETTGIILSAGTVSSLCTLAGLWIKAKFGQKTKIEPNPLDVRRIPECVSVQECNRKMTEMDARICKLEQNVANGINDLMRKLDAMDQKSEDRSVALHRRVDTISERTATTAGEVGMIKDKMFSKRK